MKVLPEDPYIFQKRKEDHIIGSLNSYSQVGLSPSQQVQLIHDPFPELDFNEIDTSSASAIFTGFKPFMVSSMTGGHKKSFRFNQTLLEAAIEKKWIFATGSLRRELEDTNYARESDWAKLADQSEGHPLIGNIGLAQVIRHSPEDILALVERYKLKGLFVHLNPLQEALQEEGTLNFKGGIKSLEKLLSLSKTPLFLKETGAGFSKQALEKIKALPFAALDVSGFGGTHWGRVEGLRAQAEKYKRGAEVFENWGVSTVDSLGFASEVLRGQELWASGGLRTGLDAAICFALGAKVCGFAQPMLKAAQEGKGAVCTLMDQIDYELKVALFCTATKNIKGLDKLKVLYGK